MVGPGTQNSEATEQEQATGNAEAPVPSPDSQTSTEE